MLEHCSAKELCKKLKNVHCLFCTDSYQNFSDKKNRFVMLSGSCEECGGLQAITVFFLFCNRG